MFCFFKHDATVKPISKSVILTCGNEHLLELFWSHGALFWKVLLCEKHVFPLLSLCVCEFECLNVADSECGGFQPSVFAPCFIL